MADREIALALWTQILVARNNRYAVDASIHRSENRSDGEDADKWNGPFKLGDLASFYGVALRNKELAEFRIEQEGIPSENPKYRHVVRKMVLAIASGQGRPVRLPISYEKPAAETIQSMLVQYDARPNTVRYRKHQTEIEADLEKLDPQHRFQLDYAAVLARSVVSPEYWWRRSEKPAVLLVNPLHDTNPLAYRFPLSDGTTCHVKMPNPPKQEAIFKSIDDMYATGFPKNWDELYANIENNVYESVVEIKKEEVKDRLLETDYDASLIVEELFFIYKGAKIMPVDEYVRYRKGHDVGYNIRLVLADKIFANLNMPEMSQALNWLATGAKHQPFDITDFRSIDRILRIIKIPSPILSDDAGLCARYDDHTKKYWICRGCNRTPLEKNAHGDLAQSVTA